MSSAPTDAKSRALPSRVQHATQLEVVLRERAAWADLLPLEVVAQETPTFVSLLRSVMGPGWPVDGEVTPEGLRSTIQYAAQHVEGLRRTRDEQAQRIAQLEQDLVQLRQVRHRLGTLDQPELTLDVLEEWERRATAAAPDLVCCARCGLGCYDYRQKGEERVCICCVTDEAGA